MEIWKEIKGFEGYEVSNLGRVKSLARTVIYSNGRVQDYKDKVLKNSLLSNGYFRVSLYKKSKMKARTIHQLVAETFLNHTPNGYKLVVDHINNVKTDNRLENLQLITARENNSKDRKGGTSGYIGVSWDKSSNKWKSRIRTNGKEKYLGMFKDELKAAEAYQTALKELLCTK